MAIHSITATEAARNLSDILNRVRYQGEVYQIVRGGEVVAKFVPPGQSRAATVRSLAETLSQYRVDENFADDLEDIQSRQPALPEPWDS